MRFETASPPSWLQDLLAAVTEGFRPEIPCGPLGYMWVVPRNRRHPWQISVFPTDGEVLEAGPDDGDITTPGFRLVLAPILSKFDSSPQIDWNVPSEYTGELDGSSVSIRGRANGRDVVLFLFEEPPALFKPTVIFDRINDETRLRPDDVEEE